MLSSVDRKMLFLHFVAEVTKSQESEMISEYYTAIKNLFFLVLVEDDIKAKFGLCLKMFIASI